jgi:hypothetical protein
MHSGEALRSLKQATTGLYAAHKLMARAFDKIGGLPMARINGLRQQHQASSDECLGLIQQWQTYCIAIFQHRLRIGSTVHLHARHRACMCMLKANTVSCT